MGSFWLENESSQLGKSNLHGSHHSFLGYILYVCVYIYIYISMYSIVCVLINNISGYHFTSSCTVSLYPSLFLERLESDWCRKKHTPLRASSARTFLKAVIRRKNPAITT